MPILSLLETAGLDQWFSPKYDVVPPLLEIVFNVREILVVTTRGCFWHLVGKGQGVC